MFNKIYLLAFVAPLVSALTLQVPQNPTSGGSITINWTAESGDPSSFTIELLNEIFHNSFGIANNVNTGDMTTTLTLPIVPVGDGYTLEAVDNGNITNVFSSTATFSIGPVTSVSQSSSSTVSASSASGSANSSSSNTLSFSTPRPGTPTSSLTGVTVSQQTSSIPASSSVASGSAPQSSASGSFNSNSALSSRINFGIMAPVLVALIAGAAAL